jgi:hypothetical protein
MANQRSFWNWFLRATPAASPEANSVAHSGAHRTAGHDPRLTHLVSPMAFVPLDSAVEKFNLLAAQDELGRHQPQLTVDEVATAIRSAGRHQLPLVESHRRLMHSIAETLQLPADAGLKFTTSWFAPSGYRCEVWWIDLVLHFHSHGLDARQASACSLRIRDHRLRSWHDPSVTVPTEIQRLQADHRWFPVNPARVDAATHH